MKRRNFIKNVMFTGGGLSLFGTNAFATAPNFTGFKALVIVNFAGGNDAMNMLVPTENTAHAVYSEVRRDLAVLNVNLYNDEYYTVNEEGYFTGALGNNQPYYKVDPANPTNESNEILMYTKGSYQTSSGLGFNALMPELASLYTKGVLSIVSNVGTLVEPTTKAQIDNGTANLPVFLFAHNHQERAVATTQAQMLAPIGWAGRLADNWGINENIGLNISYAGPKIAFSGLSSTGLSMKTTGPTVYANHVTGLVENILTRFAENTSTNNGFERYYNERNKRTTELSTLLTRAWGFAPNFTGFTAKNPYGETLFTQYESNHKANLGMLTHHGTKSDLITQLEATAKMLKVSKEQLSHQRQIIYVNMGAFDTHSDQVHQHSRNLRTISLGLSDFYKALEEMNMANDVLTVTTSEFGRTLKSNGDGTDHGWGGHGFMLCGDTSFNGGQIFGEVMTDLALDGVNAHTDRARIIPSTSIEQMLAPALKWFGVDNALMASVLPNLTNFRTVADDEESAFMQGVFVS